jgi:16S rRNA (guanine966-N2)-methyltransferase
MIRISSGTVKNKQLKIPNIPEFRGVQEIAKQSLFSILGEKVIGAVCLDLFAGSGNLGLEALSRGASWVDFVDSTKECVETIEYNVHNCGFLEMAEVSGKEAVKFVNSTDKQYDLIFVDPFYNTKSHIFLTKSLEKILKDDGVIAFFHGKDLDINALIKDTKLKVTNERKFGESFFTLISK